MDALSELFGYNRGNFMFDRKLRQEREYMEQDMRVKQFLLYREDIRDLTNLTVSKMDTYMIVALLELGCCLDLLVEGVIRNSTGPPPVWLLWLYIMSLAEAILFLLLSSWFAIQASVSCHSFSVRLLTQFVRLPLPNKAQLDAASARGTDFERMGISAFARVPVWREQVENIIENPSDQVTHPTSVAGLAEMSANNVRSLDHIRLYRDLQMNWQAYDAYARACLCIGSYTFLHAVAYYSIGLFVTELHAPWASCGACVSLPLLSWLLVRLDIYFSTRRQVAISIFLMSGPLLAMPAATLQIIHPKNASLNQNLHTFTTPVILLQHICRLVYIVYVARAEHVPEMSMAMLPTRFRNVLYLDVFGWLGAPVQSEENVDLQSRTVESVPPHVHKELLTEIQLIEQMLYLEINAWESPQNAVNMRKMPGLAASIKTLHEGLDEISGELKAFARPVGFTGASSSSSDAATIGIWLRQVWQDPNNGHEIAYYTKPSTGESQLREPEAGSLVSDIPDMRERLASLQERLQALRPPVVPVASQGFANNRRSRVSQLLTGFSSNDPSLDAASGASDRDSRRPLRMSAQRPRSSVNGSNAAATSGSLAQETRFGGREAVSDDVMLETADRQTFYPRRDPRRESLRPPGEVPWFTFFGASVILIVIWTGGALFYGYTALVELKGNHHKNSTRIAVDFIMDFESPMLDKIKTRSSWAGRSPLLASPRPVDVACHPALGPAAFLIERFAIRVVGVSGGAVPPEPGRQLRADVDGCLDAEPEFHGIGFRGANVNCGKLSCALVVHGALGNHELWCPLSVRTISDLVNTASNAPAPHQFQQPETRCFSARPIEKDYLNQFSACPAWRQIVFDSSTVFSHSGTETIVL